MFDWLFNLFRWVVNIWNDLPDSTKEKIINIIVESFESIFKDFYHSQKEEQKNKKEKND